MAKATFYCAELEPGTKQLIFNEDESRHLRAARRLRVGQHIRVLNGRGLTAEAELTQVARNLCSADILSSEPAEPLARRLTIAVAVPKGDRQRYMIESLVQLGVSKIIPLECEYSATSAHQKSVQKWPRYVIEAMKQSGNPWLTQVESGLSVAGLVQQYTSSECFAGWVADPQGEQMPTRAGPPAGQESKVEHVIAIGPEGGFSAKEQQLLAEHGFKGLQLAAYILRIEAAAIVAASKLSEN